MTQEEKLKQLERIARLLIGAGLRMRRNISQLDGKINALVDSQIRNEDKFVRDHNELSEKINIMTDAQIRYDAQLAQAHYELDEKMSRTHRNFDEKLATVLQAQASADERIATLAVSQEQTDRRMKALIELIRQQQTGETLS